MIRKLFVLAAVFGFAVNLLGDFSVLRQIKLSSASSKWVSKSYEVSRAIDSSRLTVLKAILSHSLDTNIELSFRRLTDLVTDLPSQKVRAKQLLTMSSEEILAEKDNRALAVLSEMAGGQDVLIESHLKSDAEINSTSELATLATNFIDLLLLLLFLGFFFYEYRTNARLRRSLAHTLFRVEQNNAKLISTLAERDTKFKTVVHDLKNPLGTIRGFAELMFEEKSDHASVTQMASIIQRVSNDTLKLVGSVLETADEPQENLQKFDLFQLLSETCKFLDPIATDKNQKIKIDSDGKTYAIVGQKRQLQDVFFNLVGNALKFSPIGSVVFVDCRTNGDSFEIQIKDQGPGFAEGDFANLFHPGTKLSAKPTGSEISTGFGLYSVKRTVTELGGKISITNNADNGACVKLILPAIHASEMLGASTSHIISGDVSLSTTSVF